MVVTDRFHFITNPGPERPLSSNIISHEITWGRTSLPTLANTHYVRAWKRFPHYWLLVVCDRNPSITGKFPSGRATNAEFWCFLVVCWTRCWTTGRFASDLGRNDTHVTSLWWIKKHKVCSRKQCLNHTFWWDCKVSELSIMNGTMHISLSPGNAHIQ